MRSLQTRRKFATFPLRLWAGFLYKYTTPFPAKSTVPGTTVCDETVKLEKSLEKPLDYLKNGHIINLALGDKEC